MSIQVFQANLDVDPIWKIGVVTSRFNSGVTEALEASAFRTLVELGVKTNQVHAVRVPGAYEIPFAANILLNQGCDGVIALGAVIRGETTHYDYVCSAVERGCSGLQLKSCKPVVFGVLTTENREQALARAGGSKCDKGKESVEVLIEMLNLKKKSTTIILGETNV